MAEASRAPGGAPAVEWRRSAGPVEYPEAVAEMECRVAAIRAGEAPELVWLLEHPPLYTAGTSAPEGDLLDAGRFPIYRSGRGGRMTYHGPGQRVAYVMLDLKRRRPDVRAYVQDLEEWLIRSLARFGVTAERRAGRVGLWVARNDIGGPHESEAREDKIAAIGVRIRRWVSYHGVALNVAPDLSHFAGIVPCGLPGYGVTSLAELGVTPSMAEVDRVLRECFDEVFGEPARPDLRSKS
ncbi:MAG TPA: lipoyl(octanoyl) transferase LipB [Kiloniellales bacterium]|nr:lipoyl(octanoyl) transferase LipB [Kiloniellales bacterium]